MTTIVMAKMFLQKGHRRYVTNHMIHRDLGIPAVHDVIHDRSTKHH